MEKPPREPRPGPHRIHHHDDVLPVDPDLAPDDPAVPSAAHRPSAHLRRTRQPRVLVAIAVGGFFGAFGRYEVGLAWGPGPSHFPWATFAINASGALLLGAVLTVLLERPGWWPYARPLLCVGFIGSWTTMSTFALEADLLGKDGRIGVALLYVTATVMSSIALAAVGITLGRRLGRGRTVWLSR